MTYYELAKKRMAALSKEDVCNIMDHFDSDCLVAVFGFGDHEYCAECRKRFAEDALPCCNDEIEDRNCPFTKMDLLNTEVPN